MRKLILLLAILIPLIGFSQHELPITKVFEESRPYKTHFVNDGGTMTGINSDRYLKSAYYQSIGDEMQESILFSYLGFAATSQRLDGIYSYIEELYSTTSTQQAGDGDGVELVTNGGFTGNADVWLLQAGWSYNSDNIINDGQSKYFYQPSILIIGKWYKVTMDLGRTSGSINFSPVFWETSINIATNGTNVIYAKALHTTAYFKSISYIGTIDNVSVQEMPDNFINGVQTTESSQPYLHGNIVPTQREGMQNPNGDSRYITHPEISFGATEAWSVTTCLNSEGLSTIAQDVFGNFAGTSIRIGSNENFISFINESDIGVNFASGTALPLIGKNTILTFVANGSGTLSMYSNGIFIESVSRDTDVIFALILYGRDGRFEGTISAHIIRNIALSAEQVTNEAAFLQSVYPEIPSITIETYNIATTSLDVVASSDGTTIAMASDNTDWATGLARWRYYSDDSQIGSWGNKLYNKASRDVIILNPPENWHVATEAELTVIATIDGNNLKVEGTDYWSTANGTNHSGLSAVGSGMVNTDGTFTGINTTVGFWCADSDKALIITDAGAATITSVSANEGYCIRLIEN